MKRNLFEISDNNRRYYGGDQSWYSSNTRAMGGCGSVAAANVLRALSQRSRIFNEAVKHSKLPTVCKKALLLPVADKDDYETLMTGIYNTMRAVEIFPLNRIYDRSNRQAKIFKVIKPNSGRSSIGFVWGLMSFAKKFGVRIKKHMLPTAFCDGTSALSFIKEGLRHSGAVVILTSFNRHGLLMHESSAMASDAAIKRGLGQGATQCTMGAKCSEGVCEIGGNSWKSEMKCHFATITDVIEKEGVPTKLLITTWGCPAEIDYDELVGSWKSIKAYESTLFYFTPAQSVNIYKEIFETVILFFTGLYNSVRRRA